MREITSGPNVVNNSQAAIVWRHAISDDKSTRACCDGSIRLRYRDNSQRLLSRAEINLSSIRTSLVQSPICALLLIDPEFSTLHLMYPGPDNHSTCRPSQHRRSSDLRSPKGSPRRLCCPRPSSQELTKHLGPMRLEREHIRGSCPTART